MGFIPEAYMVAVHMIRQDYAQALAAAEAFPRNHLAQETLEGVRQRRARAIRSLHREDGTSVRHLAAMFRCTKQTIREILAAEED